MITAIIIEDELNARASLRKMIHLIEPEIEILAETGFVKEAIDIIQKQKPQLIFIDIELEDGTAFDILNQLQETNFKIIFTTAYSEFAIRAFKHSAIDYLIKPVNPNQILLSLKKNLDHSRLVSEKTTSNYQQEFRKIAMDLAMVNSYEEWITIYKKLVYWELELENINDSGMVEILESQKQEANSLFFKFIKKKYVSWISDNA